VIKGGQWLDLGRGTDLPLTLEKHQRLVRIGLAVWLGSLAAVQSWLFWSQATVWPSDLEPVWAGARAWLAGRNPYDVVGPGREIDRELPLFYPFPAVLFGLPLAGLPLHVADAIFAATGTAVFAYAVTAPRLAAPALAAFVSASLWAAVQSPQWSLLLVGAALTPVLGFLLAAKPTIGVALLIAYPTTRTIIGILATGIVSIVIWPAWIGEWLQETAAGGHIVAPVTRWGGPLIFLALLRWRRPEARLLAAMACIPHTPMLYETVPLFLIPRTWPEGLILAGLSVATNWVISAGMPYRDYADWMNASGQAIVYLMYLPCVVMILRGRRDSLSPPPLLGSPPAEGEPRVGAATTP
jgi:hypothetical protein